MLLAVISGFLLAIAAPWIFKLFRDKTGWVLSLYPATLAVYFGTTFLSDVMGGATLVEEFEWVPALDITLTMAVDGLSLIFAFLISIIGTFVVIYGGGYLKGDADIPRFYVFILGFMASMLGLVLSDNLMALFVFWELTSITSFMLIGYYHDNEKYRKCAHQSMMVTVGGGLAMFAGMIVLMTIGMDAGLTATEAFSLQGLLSLDAGAITGHEDYVLALLLILGGCFTKSAQVPFHFWLPNAMAGPTPVSAYLHSATMVKAGIYLLARLHPAMGGTEIWMTVLPAFGAVTMFTGMYLALKAEGYKQVLAYSTIMALGVLTMLIGIGTEVAMQAFVAFLLAHAMYKGALFMVAGIVDHETGTKDLTVLSGLWRKMPYTTFAAVVSSISLGGIFFFGFVGKELMFEAVLDAEFLTGFLTILAVATGMLGVAVAGILGLKPFFGELSETPKAPHEAPISMLLGPVLLALGSLIFGLLPFLIDGWLVQRGVEVVAGEPIDFYLAVWHGINAPLMLSGLSIVGGALLYWKWDALRGAMGKLSWFYERGPEAGYSLLMDKALPRLAYRQTKFFQNGYLRNYLITILMVFIVLVGTTFLLNYEGTAGDLFVPWQLKFHHVVVALVMTAAAIFVSVTGSRLGAVVAVGVVGFTVALIYIMFSAPDLAITQVLVETLTVILLVLVLFRLPEFVTFSSKFSRARDLGVAILFGSLITVLLLATSQEQFFTESISQGHLDASYAMAHGRNVVNVILVDYRTLDTLGEIFVLALAAMGVYAMVKFRASDDEETP